MKIGILGGSFNPVHEGHVRLGLKAKEEYNLDQVLFVPVNFPQHKELNNDEFLSSEHRIQMLNLALADREDFGLSLVDIQRGGNTYTVDTLKDLQKELEKEADSLEFFFILGSDSFRTILSWKNYEEIIDKCSFIVAKRGNDLELHKFIIKISDQEKLISKISLLSMEEEVVSSSLVRLGLQGSKYLNEKVKAYIMENNLYPLKDIYAWTASLDTSLKVDFSEMYNFFSENRRAHIMGSLTTLDIINEVYKLDSTIYEKSKLSILFHDLFRELKKSDLLELAKNLEININQSNPVLDHGSLSATYLRKNKLIEDESILQGIKHHTLGHKNLDEVGKLLFVIDAIEINRDYEGVNELRDYVLNIKNIKRAYYRVLKSFICDTIRKDRMVYFDTYEAYIKELEYEVDK